MTEIYLTFIFTLSFAVIILASFIISKDRGSNIDGSPCILIQKSVNPTLKYPKAELL